MVLLLGLAFLQQARKSRVARLGALFCVATSLYALVSSQRIAAELGVFDEVFSIIAIFNSVFFWWFVTALFCDDFRWEWWRFAPLAGIIAFSLLHLQTPDGSLASMVGLWLWQGLVALLMVHGVIFGLNGLRDDLVGPRRLFRVVFAATAGGFGVAISVVEIIYRHGPLPDSVFLLHAIALAILALLFSSWGLASRGFLVVSDTPATATHTSSQTNPMDAADALLADRLHKAMEDKLYTRPNFTIAELATRLSVPEHQLRKLINQQLGFRNFSSFLNTYRLADAKEILSKPERARDQILLIALDLGYGSIAPFNRAFKAATGLTPTEFRKQALSSITA